jgi:ketosteroid isomerase-like protein
MFLHTIGRTAALCIVVGGCGSSSGSLTETHREAIRDSVATAMSQFQQASEEALWDSVAGFYSEKPEFRFFESGILQYESAQAVRQAFGGLPSDTRISTVYEATQIEPLAPGVALVSTSFETTFSNAIGTGFSYGGVLTLIWINESGAWRILNGHTSVPVPRGG